MSLIQFTFLFVSKIIYIFNEINYLFYFLLLAIHQFHITLNFRSCFFFISFILLTMLKVTKHSFLFFIIFYEDLILDFNCFVFLGLGSDQSIVYFNFFQRLMKIFSRKTFFFRKYSYNESLYFINPYKNRKNCGIL